MTGKNWRDFPRLSARHCTFLKWSPPPSGANDLACSVSIAGSPRGPAFFGICTQRAGLSRIRARFRKALATWSATISITDPPARSSTGTTAHMRPGYFRNRSEAGRLRAAKLSSYAGRLDVLVLVLPRGGVPAAYEVARALGEPLDVFLVRKLGVPWTRRTRDGRISRPAASAWSNNAETTVITRRSGQSQRAVSVIAHQGERSW